MFIVFDPRRQRNYASIISLCGIPAKHSVLSRKYMHVVRAVSLVWSSGRCWAELCNQGSYSLLFVVRPVCSAYTCYETPSLPIGVYVRFFRAFSWSCFYYLSPLQISFDCEILRGLSLLTGCSCPNLRSPFSFACRWNICLSSRFFPVGYNNSYCSCPT